MIDDRQKAAGIDDTEKVVVFRLGNEEFGVDISQVNRIIKISAITRIPNTPPYILGVLNLRGGIIVVVDLAMKLGFPTKPFDSNTRIIDVDINGTIVGMVVDSATELLTLDKDQIQPAPGIIQKKVNGEYLTGVAILEGRLLILLDLAKVLNTDEIATIGKVGDATSENVPTTPARDNASAPAMKRPVIGVQDNPYVRHDAPFGSRQKTDLPNHPH